MPKYIGKNDIVGELGVNLIQRIVLNMGYMWYPTGPVEAGIDGWIEIRDAETGEVRNSTIPVQSKATAVQFENDQGDSFEYRCKERDLAYWLQGSGPVILVRCRPNTDEAYWVPVKEYFADHPDDRTRRVIRFDKAKNRFDTSCAAALAELALPRELGIYFGPRPKVEHLWSNLLPVTLPPDIWVAQTPYRDPALLWRTLRSVDQRPLSSWALVDTRILSFHRLDESPWDHVCDPGTIDRFDTSEWAQTDDDDQQRMFVRLLNRTLADALTPLVRYDRDKKFYYVQASADRAPLSYTYQSRVEQATRTIFQGYPRVDGSGISYYRHGAFAGRFRRLDSSWYLEIEPTYLFTHDGTSPHRYTPQLLSGIKRLERNDAVCAQVLMWAAYVAEALARADPPSPHPGPVCTFEVESGLDDDIWRCGDETVRESDPGEDEESIQVPDEWSRAQDTSTNTDGHIEQLQLFAPPKTKYRWRPRQQRSSRSEGQ